MSLLELTKLSASVGDTELLKSLDLTIQPGELVAILGSNGAGKSTMLKCIAGLQAYQQGGIKLSGELVDELDAIQRAQRLSYLPQERPTAWPLLVSDVVALGRFAYGVSLGRINDKEQIIIDKVLRNCNLERLAHRAIDTLSGGEQARVHCARAVVAGAPLLLADEPTTSLDPKHQIDILQLLRDYVTESSSVLVVLHDPALAARFADRLIWLKTGEIVAEGTPRDTLTSDTLREVYEVEATVTSTGKYLGLEIHQSLPG